MLLKSLTSIVGVLLLVVLTSPATSFSNDADNNQTFRDSLIPMLFCLNIATPPSGVLPDTDWTSWNGGVDVAESGLRVLLRSDEIPPVFATDANKLNAKKYLLEIKKDYPGLLEGELDPGFNWPQYEGVKSLYQELVEMDPLDRCIL